MRFGPSASAIEDGGRVKIVRKPTVSNPLGSSAMSVVGIPRYLQAYMRCIQVTRPLPDLQS
jgi:hypothetical protein